MSILKGQKASVTSIKDGTSKGTWICEYVLSEPKLCIIIICIQTGL